MFRPGRWYQRPMASSSSSLLEEALQPLATMPAPQRPDNRIGPLPVPRTYVAVVERPPLVELGVRDTVDAGSLYVILGAY